MELRVFDNEQLFDFQGLKGRLLSSSYMPKEDDTGYPAMIQTLEELFDQYQQDDQIILFGM